MNKLLFYSFVLQFLLLAARAQVPATLSYQGLLTDVNGAPVPDGSHNIFFNFYPEETGGTSLFNRGPVQCLTFKGLFTVILGNGQGTNNAALPPDFGDRQYWIGVTPDGESELSPRAMLTAVPYAFRAQFASNVDGAAITSGTVPNGRLDPNLQDLADGILSGSKIGTGISAANITTGTLSASVLPAASVVPVGTIIAYGGKTIPAGWLKCDGTAAKRTDYSDLFTAIGVVWGGGDGTTTFNLPDLRGIFLRGVDDASGNDPDVASRTAKFTLGNTGDNVGSYQGDAFQGHQHQWISYSIYNAVGSVIGANMANATGPQTNTTSSITSDGSHGSPRTAFETRPKNAMVYYIIKY